MSRGLFMRSLPAAIGLTVVLAGASMFAIDTDTAFNTANKLYEQGSFAEAASDYEKILQAGATSPVLYYNLGNARFKSGEVGRALAAYRHAEQLAPRDPDLRANLQFVRNQIQGPTLQPSRFQLWLKKLTPNEWTALTAAAFWLSLVSLTVMQLRPRWRQSLRTFVLIGSLCTAASGICLLLVLSADAAPIAIVTAKNGVVRNGPFDESPTSLTVHDGAELHVLDTKDGWLQVGVGNRIGWLKRDETILLSGS
jgi:tetratricopeptide (TPR) repeat protein